MLNHRPKRRIAENLIGTEERKTLKRRHYSIFDSVGWLARAASKRAKVKRIEKSAKA
jgi:hypothetical protein